MVVGVRAVGVGISLDEYVGKKVFRGILTGLNKAFVIDLATKQKLIESDPKSAELIKSFLVGKDIRRYQLSNEERFLILMKKGWTREKSNRTKDAWKWFRENYPAISLHLEPFAKKAIQERQELNKALSSHLTGLGVNEKMVEELIRKLELPEDLSNWDGTTLKKLATELRKTTKPMIIACNKIDVKGAAENFTRLENEFPDHMLVACSAESELALREAAKHELIEYIPGENDFKIKDESKLTEKQKKALDFIKENVLKKFGSTGLEDVLDDAVFKLLKYIAVYPVANSHLQDKDGNILPDCFLVPDKITALGFAFKVHTDIGENFIKAVDLKTKKIIGKEHQLKNGDVIEIITNK